MIISSTLSDRHDNTLIVPADEDDEFIKCGRGSLVGTIYMKT